VAANWLPFGTRVRLSGLRGTFTVEDRMSRRYSRRVDVYLSSHAEAQKFGVRRFQLTVVAK
jgi:3D (Asp-Asp-Asp) domain-containing protein